MKVPQLTRIVTWQASVLGVCALLVFARPSGAQDAEEEDPDGLSESEQEATVDVPCITAAPPPGPDQFGPEWVRDAEGHMLPQLRIWPRTTGEHYAKVSWPTPTGRSCGARAP
jgi:hypothetical protein